MKKKYRRYKRNRYGINYFMYLIAGLYVVHRIDLFHFYFNKNYLNIIYSCALLLGLFFVGLLLYTKRMKNKKYLSSTLYTIDLMTGVEFEEFLKVHFEKKGYIVKMTPKSNDYGIDLICKSRKLFTENELNGFVIQAKRYNKKVGVSAVQQVIAGMKYYDCQYGMVITNNYFTRNAWELAKKSGVTLWDRNILQKKFDLK